MTKPLGLMFVDHALFSSSHYLSCPSYAHPSGHEIDSSIMHRQDVQFERKVCVFLLQEFWHMCIRNACYKQLFVKACCFNQFWLLNINMTTVSQYYAQNKGNPSPGLAVVSIGTLHCAQLLWKQPQLSLTSL